MCARFSMLASPAEIQAFLDAPYEDEPRAQIVSPTDMSPALVMTSEGKQIKTLKWGLIPYWAEDASIARRTINARADTAAEKPAFREAFKRRRCVIPVSGVYEWREEPVEPTLDLGIDPPKSKKSRKQPYLFRLRESPLLGLAGLWERWQGPSSVVETFTVLTTDPNQLVAEFHDRMPCILLRDDFNCWIEIESEASALKALLAPLPAELMLAHPATL
jgi:putative SOS response-associated peptidase YedK